MAAFTKKAMSLELNPLAIGNITLSARHVLNVLGVHKKYLKARVSKEDARKFVES